MYARTGAGTAPVSLAEAKAHLKVDSTADDSLITSLLSAATDVVSDFSGRRYATGETWQLLLDELEDRNCLMRSPVSAVTAVEYLVAGVWTAIAPSTYYVKLGDAWSWLLLADGETWPTDGDDVELNLEHAFRVSFTTGAHQPSLGRAKQAILRLVAATYDDRGDYETMGEAALHDLMVRSGAAMLLGSSRVQRV